MSFLFCRWWQWLQCNGRQLDIALFVKATTDEQKEILLSSGPRMNSWDHILLYCRLLTVLCKWFDWSGNCCIVVTLLCSLTRVLTAAHCSVLLSLLHLLPQSSSEGFSCATIHHLEFWCILKRLLFMYWPEAREGVCVSFKIHLALEGKAGGGRWTNQPTNHSHRAEVLLTNMRAWSLCWQGKGWSNQRKLTLQVTCPSVKLN